MQNASPQPSAGRAEGVMKAYGDMLYRIALIMLKNARDAEDAVQDTMLKYLSRAPAFEDSEHEKAWLIRVLRNRCLDMRRFSLRHPKVDIDDLQAAAPDAESCGILEALMALPERFRSVLTLHYVEEYKVEDVARLIGKSPSAVKMRLKKGRELLEKAFEKERVEQ